MITRSFFTMLGHIAQNEESGDMLRQLFADYSKVEVATFSDRRSVEDLMQRFILVESAFFDSVPVNQSSPEDLVRMILYSMEGKIVPEYMKKKLLLDEVVWFGKYLNKRWGDIDLGYLKWLQDKHEDDFVREVAEKVLNIRMQSA